MARRKIQAVLAQMQKNLECSICLEMMKNPVSTACGHQFCKFCITEFLERKKQVPCPLCKKAVTKRGMKERQQLGEIVSNVLKLIEAYQADTGSLFSPPRGCSMNMLPSTPDSIKTKQTKPASRRQSNIRGSNSVSTESRTARESRRLNMNVKQNKQQPQGMADEEIDFGDDDTTVNNVDDKLKNTHNSSVQNLLDLIETGSHGAVEDRSQSETEVNIPKNSKSLQKQLSVPNTNSLDSGMEDADMYIDHNQPVDDVEGENKCLDRIEGNVGECNRAYWDNGNENGKHGNHNQLEEFIQSGKSASSQSSSEDVISLFRTPLDMKANNQKPTKCNIQTKKSTRSLRSDKASNAIPDHLESNAVENLTPDGHFTSDIFDTKQEVVKTYSRKNSLEKDVKSKRKVSDWLKGLPNDKSEAAALSKNLTDVTNKASHKPVSANQPINEHMPDVIGDGRDMQDGSVSISCDGSLFGFEALDKTADKPILSSDKGNQDNANNKKVEISANSDRVQNDINTAILNQPVQRKRIFKSKQNKSRNSDAVAAQQFPNVDSSTEEGNQEKLNPKDIAGRLKTNDIEKAAGKVPEKAERLLKMSDSPMNGSPGGLDPYEFRSSQKTPQKMKNDAASKPKRSKAKNAKKKIVNVTKTQKTKDMSKSTFNVKLEGGKPKMAHKNKIDIENRLNSDVTSSQLNAISAIIDEAEDHDLLTCTQDALKNMPEHETHSSKYAKHQDESKTSKKQVRFREPALADFISPGKINIAAYREEKKMFKEKKELQNTTKNNARKQNKGNHIVHLDRDKNLLSDKVDKPDCHEQGNEKKTLPDVKTRKSEMPKQHTNDRPLKEDNKRQDPTSKDEENDSDDVSDDFRFHDDSSGTDDLDINPDVGEFEQPDLEKQPKEVKMKLTGTVIDNDSVVSTECRSPDVNSVKDTPQVQKGPRFNSRFSKPVKVPSFVQKVVNIVAETPLYVDQDSEPETQQTDCSTVNAEMNENPVIGSDVNDVNDDNDEDANTACDNYGKRSLTDNVTVVESEPLNLNIETLTETDDVIPDSIALVDSMEAKELDQEHGNTQHDDCITDKAADIETRTHTDTDETQTPSGDFNTELGDRTVIDGDVKDKEDCTEIDTGDNVQETMVSLADSQRSMSVLEIDHGKGKSESHTNQYNNKAILETDEKLIVTESDFPKVKKKKRKCFMLEDTQGDEEFCSSMNSSNESVSKRQKMRSPNNQKATKGMNRDKNSGQFSSGVEITKTDTTVTEKTTLDKKNDSEEEIVLISQNSADIQPSCQKERHLSGILMSPDESQKMSPENIFCIDSEMPRVNLSPEEETQCSDSVSGTQQDGIKEDLINDSLTQKTHVSDTQTSQEKLTSPKRTQPLVTQERALTPIGNKRNQPSGTKEKMLTPSGSKRRSCVKASRGFSKRTRLSDDGTVMVGTPRTPQTPTNSNTIHASPHLAAGSNSSQHESPKGTRHLDDSEHTVRAQRSPLTHHSPRLPTRTKQSGEAETHEVIITSPSVNKVLNTPRRQNLLKYRSPVAGITPLRSHNTPTVIKTPSTPLSAATLKISKYSPGIHKTLVSKHSPISKETLINQVEVVEIDCSVTKDGNESCPLAENAIKKKSPVLQLKLGSQERSKLVEHVPIGQIAESEADERIEDTPLPCLKHVDEFKRYGNVSLQSTEANEWNNEKGELDDPCMDDDVNTDGLENQIDMNRNTKLDKLTPLIGDPDEDSSSSDDLCLDDSFQMDETTRRNDARQANIISPMSYKKVYSSVGKLNEFSHNLLLDDSTDSEIDNDDNGCNVVRVVNQELQSSDCDSEIDNDDNGCEVLRVLNQVLQSSDCDSDIVESEALVIEESDLEDEPKKPDADLDDIRKVRRLRPKRAILSDRDCDSEDESTHLDCTSSSAFSSQSENLTTQDREKLVEDLEKMEAEMAILRNQLNESGAGKKSTSNKGPVTVLDDDDGDDDDDADDDRIEGDDSDIENEHEMCMSPPPFSPVIMSQEQSSHHASQESTQEPINIEKDSMNNIDRLTGTELSTVRKPLKDIDVNIVSKISDKDQTKDLPVENKRLGFVATGLSSLQVMEIKKLAAANDVVFYSKMNPSVSHVIVKADEDDNRMCDRTLKFFQGVVNKCWLVIYQWVIDSKEAGYLVPEGHYEIQGDTTLGILHNGPRKSRLAKDDLFKGLQFSLFGDNRYLNKDSLMELIEACGGEMVSGLAHNRHSTLVICCTDLEEEGSQENSEAVSKSKELKKEYGVVTLKRDWVMDSLTTYNVQPFKPYTIL